MQLMRTRWYQAVGGSSIMQSIHGTWSIYSLVQELSQELHTAVKTELQDGSYLKFVREDRAMTICPFWKLVGILGWLHTCICTLAHSVRPAENWLFSNVLHAFDIFSHTRLLVLLCFIVLFVLSSYSEESILYDNCAFFETFGFPDKWDGCDV